MNRNRSLTVPRPGGKRHPGWTSLVLGLLSMLGNACAEERMLKQVSLGPASTTTPSTLIRYALAESTDKVYLQTDAVQMLVSPSRQGALANVYYRDPRVSAFSAIPASGGSAQPVQLVGTDATGRWLAVEAGCRLDHFGSGQCEPIPSVTEHASLALFLIDRNSGDATLITHRLNDPQTPVLDEVPRNNVQISRDGRYVYFHSSADGLVDETPTAPGSSRLYVYDLTTRRAKRADQLADSSVAPSSSAVLWFSPDGRQALVQTDLHQLLVVEAATGVVRSAGQDALGPAKLTADDQGRYLLSCRRYVSDVTGIVFLQWSRITLGDGMTLPLNAPPSGFTFTGACLEQGYISDDGNIATVTLLEPTLDPVTESQRVRLMQWRLSDGRQTLISRRPNAPTEPVSDGAGLLDASSDGRLVVFAANPTDPVPQQSGIPVSAIYLYDRTLDQVKLVSANQQAPHQAMNGSTARLNDAGSMIYFLSNDPLTGDDDANQTRDLFAYRIADATTQLLSHRQTERTPLQRGDATRPVVSRNGTRLAYDSTDYAPTYGGLFQSPLTQQVMLNRAGGAPLLVSRRRDAPTQGGDRDSAVIGFSADGRYLAFQSRANNLDTEVPYQRLGPDPDTFVLDLDRNAISLVTHPMGGPHSQAVGRGESVAIDASGEWILHATSHAGAFVPGFVDTAILGSDSMLVLLPTRGTAAPILISHAAANRLIGADRAARHLAHSPDMNIIAFASPASNLADTVVQTSTEQLYVHDRSQRSTRWLTRSAFNPMQQANGVFPPETKTFVSTDGRYLVFTHSGTDLLTTVEAGPQTFDCYRYDLRNDELALVSTQSTEATQHAYCEGLSDDGRYVLYTETNTHQGASVAQIWRQDLSNGTRVLVSQSDRGLPANGGVSALALSRDGNKALFLARDSSLISQATPSQTENLYLRAIDQAQTSLISDGVAPGINPAARTLNSVTASDDFGVIAFADTSDALANATLDLNGHSDIFVSRGPALTDNPGLSGLWGEPGVDGQGFHLINLPETRQMLLSWYTYLPLGSTPTRTNQQWLIGLGQIEDGSASFALRLGENGAFDSNVGGGVQGNVGNVTIRFIDCLHAEAHYSLGVGQQALTGVIPVTRVSPDTVCAAYQRQGPSALTEVPRPANSGWQYGMSGAWHNDAKPGQGFLLEVLPRSQQVLATWFTFDPSQPLGNGAQAPLWLAAIGDINGNRAHLNVYESVNGRFDQAGGNQLRAVGTLDLDAVECQTSVANYALTLGGVARSGQIPLSRITSSSLCRLP